MTATVGPAYYTAQVPIVSEMKVHEPGGVSEFRDLARPSAKTFLLPGQH